MPFESEGAVAFSGNVDGSCGCDTEDDVVVMGGSKVCHCYVVVTLSTSSTYGVPVLSVGSRVEAG